jgi:hypothetical protein
MARRLVESRVPAPILRAALALLPALALGGGPAPRTDASGAEGAWLERAQSSIAAREYWASESGGGLQAPNRAHDLRTWFEPTGIRLHARTAPGSPALLGLQIAGVGRREPLAVVEAGQVVSVQARVEIRRDGLVEWYENRSDGLEQGFTLARRPDGEGPLVVELGVALATASLRGDEVRLRTPAGRTLHYAKLFAEDAAGRALAARFEVPDPACVRLVVEDAGAAYPLLIDPLVWSTPDHTIASGQSDGEFGQSVASAGDVNGDGFADVIVGAPEYDAGQVDEGAAFVFLGSSGGITAASPSAANAQIESNQTTAILGDSVASAGDVNGDGYSDVIVGARLYDDGETNEGAAFVFHGGPSGIVASGNPGNANATLESNQSWDGITGSPAFFGASVASAGDVNGDGYADVIVGAPAYDNGTTDEGAAFVYLGGGSGIATTVHATLESDQAGAGLLPNFGLSVASAGDVQSDGYADVVVGAVGYDSGQTDEGAAFVFHGSASGITSGGPGAAATLLQSDQVGAQLGTVASAGDVNGDGYSDVIVGAYGYDVGSADEGAAFVFHGGASGITSASASGAQAQILGDQIGAKLGSSVASAGDVDADGHADVIVGAHLYDDVFVNEGKAFVYRGSAAGVVTAAPVVAYVSFDSDSNQARLGISVASAGDVNGDGYSDVIAGAPEAGPIGTSRGAAFLALGGPLPPYVLFSFGSKARLESNQASASFGSSVAAAGDVNGDGYTDLIVGAPGYDAGETDEGAAFIFLGSSTGIGDSGPGGASALLESDQEFSSFGTTVASAGDVNGDGYADVIVGALHYSAGETGEGAAFVFHGGPGGIASGNAASAAAQLESNQTGMGTTPWFGFSLASGDLNADGYSDLIVGAPYYDAGQTDEGAAFAFHGSAGGIGDRNPANAEAQLESDQTGAGETPAFGWSVAVRASSPYSDVAVGAPYYDGAATDEGAAFVYLGSATGISSGGPPTTPPPLSAAQAGSLFGYSVADGPSGLMVGAPGYDDTLTGQGAIFFYSVSYVFPIYVLEGDQPWGIGASLATSDLGAFAYVFGTLGNSAVFAFEGPASGIFQALTVGQSGAGWGTSVAAGDFDGDGRSEAVIGAPGHDEGETDEGAVFVMRHERGRPVRPVQRRTDGFGTPVQPWGSAHTPDAFEVEIVGTHPAGHGRVAAEIQICSPCTTVRTPWADVGAASPDAVLSHTFTGLVPDSLYSWQARVLHASGSAAQAGITPPPNPAHGPWRQPLNDRQGGYIRTGVPDNDGDGIGNAVEMAGPNGGDANGDGTLDALQAGVVSLPEAVSGAYVSLEVSGGCVSLSQVAITTENDAPVPDPGFDYPLGLVGFTAPCSAATVELFFHGATSLPPPYRKYGPTTPGVPATSQWYSLPTAVFDSVLIGGQTVARVTLPLADGALGDETGVDGQIVDPGGPALTLIPALPWPAFPLLAAALVAAGARRLRRAAAR